MNVENERGMGFTTRSGYFLATSLFDFDSYRSLVQGGEDELVCRCLEGARCSPHAQDDDLCEGSLVKHRMLVACPCGVGVLIV